MLVWLHLHRDNFTKEDKETVHFLEPCSHSPGDKELAEEAGLKDTPLSLSEDAKLFVAGDLCLWKGLTSAGSTL